jgi:hypothetical protein
MIAGGLFNPSLGFTLFGWRDFIYASVRQRRNNRF